MKLQNKIQLNQQAFTLVELIVVITILAILWTIAFISLQWYSAQARDSKRISDIENIKKSLELFSLRAWQYPFPDGYFTVKYGTQDLRYQGTIWDEVATNLSRNLNEKPTDPLTELEYIYSRTYGWNEYEVLSIYESDLISYNGQTNSAHANYPKISGNYNWVYVKAWSHIVPTPSIINANVWWPVDLVVTSNYLESEIITWWSNNIANAWIDSSTWWLFWMTVEVFTWTLDTDIGEDDGGGKVKLAETLIEAYSWTVLIEEDWIYKEIVETVSEDFVELIDVLVFGNDSSSSTSWSSSTTWWGNTTTPTITWWRVLDDNCHIEDIHIPAWCIEWEEWCQIWAWCNSTLWDWLEWWKQDDWSDATIYCTNYDGDSISNDSYCSIWNVLMASNSSAKNFFDLQQDDWTNQFLDSEFDTIWWKLYTWSNSSSACPTWRSVPTDTEWTTLENTLKGSICRTWDGGQCYGLWWRNHHEKTDTNSLVNALKIPLAGNRHSDTMYLGRGYFTFLWSSTLSITDYVYCRYLDRDDATVYRDDYSQFKGYSVRCIKD